jgi:hypothetical protein
VNDDDDGDDKTATVVVDETAYEVSSETAKLIWLLCLDDIEKRATPIHYSHADIEAAAVGIGSGYRVAKLTLQVGDTAESMLSDKWCFGGPGTVEYLIHATGWSVSPSDTVFKHWL